MPDYSTSPVTPYLLYEDVGGALDWLAMAFGFEKHVQQESNGRITHAEMTFGDNGVVMLGWPGPQYQNPKHLGHATQNLYVRVEGIDRHFERAVKAGAVVLEKPADQPYGDRRYGVEDPEGHRWYFAEKISGTDAG